MFAIMTTVRCARSEVGLSRLPVTEEIAGSNPVERATIIYPLHKRVFFYVYKQNTAPTKQQARYLHHFQLVIRI